MEALTQQMEYARLLEKENRFFCVRCLSKKLSLFCGRTGLDETPQGGAQGGSLAAHGKADTARYFRANVAPVLTVKASIFHLRMPKHISNMGAIFQPIGTSDDLCSPQMEYIRFLISLPIQVIRETGKYLHEADPAPYQALSHDPTPHTI